ncbi:MAG: YdjY domain-containing protein [Planctomycetota bacterium]|nr:YdjY domain-containing protein [Planctomycetota bacterium]
MKSALVSLGTLLAFAAAAIAQPESAPATAPASRPGVLVRPHMVIHTAPEQKVVVDAEVCTRDRIIEFLAVTKGNREYEAILRTEAKAADLHLAMLTFGLTPGKPATWVWDGDKGHYIPPRGPKVKIEFEWTDPKTNTPRRAEPSDWIINPAKKGTLPVPKEWVFIGSEVLPDGKYRGDEEGVVVAVANDPAAVIDVPFESSKDERRQELVANEKTIPPPGTPVKLIFTVVPGGRTCPDARTLVEIDRNGDAYIHGQQVPLAQLRAWAEKYVQRHEKGACLLRSDARALVCDAERVRDELKIGGVFEFDEQRLLPQGVVLPRTTAQAAQELAEWKKMFANPREEIVDPGRQAAEALAQVQSELERMADQRTLLEHYRKQLQEQLTAYEPIRKAREAQRALEEAQDPATRPAARDGKADETTDETK